MPFLCPAKSMAQTHKACTVVTGCSHRAVPGLKTPQALTPGAGVTHLAPAQAHAASVCRMACQRPLAATASKAASLTGSGPAAAWNKAMASPRSSWNPVTSQTCLQTTLPAFMARNLGRAALSLPSLAEQVRTSLIPARMPLHLYLSKLAQPRRGRFTFRKRPQSISMTFHSPYEATR